MFFRNLSPSGNHLSLSFLEMRRKLGILTLLWDQKLNL